MKKISLFIAFILTSVSGFTQDTATPTKSFWSDPVNDPLLPLYLVFALAIVVTILILMVAVYMLQVLNLIIEQAARERAARLGVVYQPEPGMFSKLWEKLNASVPVEQEKNIELDHNYDGIRELDNHLPPWWKWLFYGTIAWSAVYMFIYHVSDSMPLMAQEFENEVTSAEEAKAKFLATQPTAVIDEKTLTYTADAELLSKGKQVFISNACNSCHGADGGGNTVGPNLTDAYWLHGGDIKSIFKTIKDGVVEKGMPAWGKVMSPQDVRNVSFYIMSLQGTKPTNPKAPQGTLYEPVPVASDSVNTTQ
jgi:cytochrome c oxidase cbb3-type subunit 3